MIFRTIPDYPAYEISEEGVVRNINTQYELKTFFFGRYVKVQLMRECKGYTLQVHALVMQAHVGPRPDGMCIRHLDGDPKNNHLSNLAYGSLSENQRDRLRHGNLGMKLNVHQVRLIKALHKKAGITQQWLADLFGCKQSNISCIQRGITWADA